ncbi:hypothetical protein L1887_58730 [Cichorium endivia]|nr:hypothetical protein L1887_58730 [Cichorium endivia]
MQKAGPQSFSAPPPPEPTSDAETSPSAFRASSLFKMPAFGSPVLTSGARRASGPASEASASAVEKAAPPPVPARPKAESKSEAGHTVHDRPWAVADGRAGESEGDLAGSHKRRPKGSRRIGAAGSRRRRQFCRCGRGRRTCRRPRVRARAVRCRRHGAAGQSRDQAAGGA